MPICLIIMSLTLTNVFVACLKLQNIFYFIVPTIHNYNINVAIDVDFYLRDALCTANKSIEGYSMYM